LQIAFANARLTPDLASGITGAISKGHASLVLSGGNCRWKRKSRGRASRAACRSKRWANPGEHWRRNTEGGHLTYQ